MRNAFLAGASAFALVLGGCSMFQSSDHAARNTGSHQTPAYSGSSQAPSPAQSQAPSPMGSMSSHTMAKNHSRSSMNGEDVKEAQQKLKDDGDYNGQVDGKFGAQTAQAVKQFQQKNGLKQTGRLDRDTRAKLGADATMGSGSSTPPDGTPNSGTGMPATTKPSGSL